MNLNYARKVKSYILQFEKNTTFVIQNTPKLDAPAEKGSIILMRITPGETEIFNQLKKKYKISCREIFEIICNGECNGEFISGKITRGNERKSNLIEKQVQIPRRLLTKKKT